MKDYIDEILNQSKDKKMNIPKSFTNTILNFTPNTIESRNLIMKFNIKRKIIAVALSIFFISGAVFAGTKVYENIWKEPEKIEIVTSVVTPEAEKENISEEKAKEIAINKLNQIGFNSNIVSTDHYKEIDSNKIMYRFITEDDYEISIDGQKAEFFEISDCSKSLGEIDKKFYGYGSGKNVSSDYFMNKDKAVEVANKYYKLFEFKEGEYEVTNISSFGIYGDSELEKGYKFSITYNKKYGDTYNPYEYVIIQVYAKDEIFSFIRTENIPYDNNPTEITKEQALQIALEVDKNIEEKEIDETKVEEMIVKMNAKAYYRLKDKERFYKEMSTVDYPLEERVYYQMEDRIRNAWVVVIDYIDDWPDIVTSCTRGQFSYFIDSTTGEVIGGSVGDYITYR